MREHIRPYKDKLEKGICEYMQNPVSERSAEAVKHMVHAWMACDKMERKMYSTVGWNDFTADDARAWASRMMNADGTMGAHWPIETTTAVGQANGVDFTHMCDWCWWAAMNMMYSDYCRVAEKFGVGTPEFYAEMAKAFLMDQDGPGPEKKLGAYYVCVVKHE